MCVCTQCRQDSLDTLDRTHNQKEVLVQNVVVGPTHCATQNYNFFMSLLLHIRRKMSTFSWNFGLRWPKFIYISREGEKNVETFQKTNLRFIIGNI